MENSVEQVSSETKSIQQLMNRFKKSDKWGSAETKVLISKGCEFLNIIQVDRKDAGTLERKRWAWDLIANSVNEANLTGSIRTGKDCNSKWTQMKCKAHGDLEEMKKMANLENESEENEINFDENNQEKEQLMNSAFKDEKKQTKRFSDQFDTNVGSSASTSFEPVRKALRIGPSKQVASFLSNSSPILKKVEAPSRQESDMSQVVEALHAIQQTQTKVHDALLKISGEAHDICVSLMALTNAYVEVHKTDNPNVENFHLSLPNSQ